MLTLRTGSKHLIREINQALVLNAIRTVGPLSRTEVAARTQLALPTVSSITAELIEAGLLYERATGASTGGRPPVLLALNPRAGHVVGAKLTEERAILVLTDLEATILAYSEAPLPSTDPQAIVETLATAVKALAAEANAQPLFGVGVGLAGVVDRSGALVRHATYFGWNNLAFGSLLEAQLDLPVVIDNDVNALTAAEQWFGAGRSVPSFMVISLGRGVGMGMVLDGRLYRGATGGAGEFGHMTVDLNGPLCACGKRGCLEALVSDRALEQQAAAALGRQLTIQEAVDGAQGGDAQLQAIFAQAGRTLGIAAANAVNLINPGLIIVGGEGTRAGGLLMDPFASALREHSFNGLFDHVPVVTGPWGDEAWARGAASLLLGELFEPSLRQGQEVRPSLTARSGDAALRPG